MNAWGTGPFENEIAQGWLSRLEASHGTSAIEMALYNIEFDVDYFYLNESAEAVASAEIVAALLGHPAPDLPDSARSWVLRNTGLGVAEVVPTALHAVERVCNYSELRDLYERADDLDVWTARLDDLVDRLGANPSEVYGG